MTGWKTWSGRLISTELLASLLTGTAWTVEVLRSLPVGEVIQFADFWCQKVELEARS